MCWGETASLSFYDSDCDFPLGIDGRVIQYPKQVHDVRLYPTSPGVIKIKL